MNIKDNKYIKKFQSGGSLPDALDALGPIGGFGGSGGSGGSGIVNSVGSNMDDSIARQYAEQAGIEDIDGFMDAWGEQDRPGGIAGMVNLGSDISEFGRNYRTKQTLKEAMPDIKTIMEGNKSQARYDAKGPDNLNMTQGSFGFESGGVVGSVGTSLIDQMANETHMELARNRPTTKKGEKEYTKKFESLVVSDKVKQYKRVKEHPFTNQFGYTPGTDSFNNPYNTIPSENITMENTPFPITGIPINEYGEMIGNPTTMEPGGFYRFPNAYGVLELPNMQFGAAVSSPSIKSKSSKKSKRKVSDSEFLEKIGFKNNSNKKEKYESIGIRPLTYKAPNSDIEWELKGGTGKTPKPITDEIDPEAIDPEAYYESLAYGVSPDTIYNEDIDRINSNALIPDSIKNFRIKTYRKNKKGEKIAESKTVEELGIKTWGELQKKGGQAFEAGYNHPEALIGTAMLSNKLAKKYPKRYSHLWLAGQNDNWHKRRWEEKYIDSGHLRGYKTDLSSQLKGEDAEYYTRAEEDAHEVYKEMGLEKDTHYRIIGPQDKEHGKDHENHLDIAFTKAGRKKFREMYMNERKQYVEQAKKENRHKNPTKEELEKMKELQFLSTTSAISYQFGGPNKYNNMNNKYQMGGPTPQQEQPPMPIQAEKGEMITLPDGKIVKTLATKRHSQMHDDEVTDVLPVGSMIWSRDRQMMFDKNEYIAGQRLGDISIGKTPISYSETEQQKPIEDVKLFDNISKDKFTPAEYAKSLKRSMPLTDRENDAFAELSRRENTMQRLERLSAFAELSMYKKDQVELVEGLDEQKPLPKYQYGGGAKDPYEGGGMIAEDPYQRMLKTRDNAAMYNKNTSFGSTALNNMATSSNVNIPSSGMMNFNSIGSAPKAFTGLEVAAAAGAIDTIMGIGKSIGNTRRRKKTEKMVNKNYQDNLEHINNARNMNMAGATANLLANDVGFTRKDYTDPLASTDSAYADADRRISADQRRTSETNNATVNGLASNPNMTYNQLNSAQAQAITGNNQSAMQYSNMRNQTALQGNQMRNRYLLALADDKQLAGNTVRHNSNALTSNYISSMTTSLAGAEQAKMDAGNARVAAIMGARNQHNNAANNIQTQISSGLRDTAYYASKSLPQNNGPSFNANEFMSDSPSFDGSMDIPSFSMSEFI